jgi:hypothetical protein
MISVVNVLPPVAVKGNLLLILLITKPGELLETPKALPTRLRLIKVKIYGQSAAKLYIYI